MLSAPNTLFGVAIFVVAICFMPIAAAGGCGVCPETCGGASTGITGVAMPGANAEPAAPRVERGRLCASSDCTAQPLCAIGPLTSFQRPLRI